MNQWVAYPLQACCVTFVDNSYLFTTFKVTKQNGYFPSGTPMSKELSWVALEVKKNPPSPHHLWVETSGCDS